MTLWYLFACGLGSLSYWPTLPIDEGRIDAIGAEVLWVSYALDQSPKRLATSYRDGLIQDGWRCEALREVKGHGWVAGCERENRPQKLLSVSELPEKIFVSINNAHGNHMDGKSASEANQTGASASSALK